MNWAVWFNDLLRAYPLVTGAMAGATVFLPCYMFVKMKYYTQGWRQAEEKMLEELWPLADSISRKNLELLGSRDLFPTLRRSAQPDHPLIVGAKRDWGELVEWIDLYRKGVLEDDIDRALRTNADAISATIQSAWADEKRK